MGHSLPSLWPYLHKCFLCILPYIFFGKARNRAIGVDFKEKEGKKNKDKFWKALESLGKHHNGKPDFSQCPGAVKD